MQAAKSPKRMPKIGNMITPDTIKTKIAKRKSYNHLSKPFNILQICLFFWKIPNYLAFKVANIRKTYFIFNFFK